MKLYNWLILISLNILFTTYSQVTSPTRFPMQEYFQNNYESCLLGLPNNEALMFWYDSSSSVIRYARGNNDMLYWYSQDSISYINSSNKFVDINVVILNSGEYY